MGGYPALMIQGPESPLKEIGQLEQIKGEVQHQQMGAIQLQQARVAADSRQALMALWANSGGDMNKTIADARASGKVTPEDLMGFQTHAVDLQVKAAQLTKDQLANEEKTNDIFANTLESFRQLPESQRTPDAVKSTMAGIANQGVDISKYVPMFQQLAQNPSDDTIKSLELSLKGRQWVTQNEKVQREENSAPTVSQAQQKTQTELSKATDEAKAAHISLLSMPSPEEAKTTRMALLRKTNAETAAAEATTAEKKAQTALVGAEPVIAFDPATGQRVLTTMPQAKALSYTNPVKVGEGDIQKENEAQKQFNVMQSSISTYRGSLAKMGSVTDDHAKIMASLMSDKNIFGTLGDHALGAVGMGTINDAITSLEKADRFNQLLPAEQQTMVDYIRAKTAVPLVQKALTGVGRMNESVMNLDMAMIPAPIEGPSANMKLDAFQKTIDAASQGLTRVPWLPTSMEVRKAIEGHDQREAQSTLVTQQKAKEQLKKETPMLYPLEMPK